MFKISSKGKKLHSGQLITRRGSVGLPVFMPIATKGAVKSLTSEELRSLGADLILGNTYHLWHRPGLKVIQKFNGLHRFMNWSGPILTDSGGYQIFSLENKMRDLKATVEGENRPVSSVKIMDKGAEFRDPLDGRTYFLTPEKSMEIQLRLGSDIIMVLDECPAFPCTRDKAEAAVKRTTDWAKRCKKYFEKEMKQNDEKINRPLLFGIVQGGIYKDLRQQSARELLAIGFDGYAIGGVAVGEPRRYLGKVLDAVLPLLPEDKPRYLMGLGRPEEIVKAVGAGVDMFDCVIPTREARHGRLYIYSSTKPWRQGAKARGEVLGSSSRLARTIKSDFYKTVQITNHRFAGDTRPLDAHCGCYTCQHFSRAYLHHLFRTGEPLALRLATIHNLKFYLDLMKQLKDNVKFKSQNEK